jgi:hypothetical protein
MHETSNFARSLAGGLSARSGLMAGGMIQASRKEVQLQVQLYA